MTSNQKKKSKLPPEKEDKVVEISLRHVIMLFAALGAGTLVVGSSLILVRDFSRTKRQQALFENTKEIIKLFQKETHNERNKHKQIRDS